jgi:hypothetical protein
MKIVAVPARTPVQRNEYDEPEDVSSQVDPNWLFQRIPAVIGECVAFPLQEIVTVDVRGMLSV